MFLTECALSGNALLTVAEGTHQLNRLNTSNKLLIENQKICDMMAQSLTGCEPVARYSISITEITKGYPYRSSLENTLVRLIYLHIPAC
jgi:hypothetical protein